MPLIVALERQDQVILCEFKVILLIYIVSLGHTGIYSETLVSQKNMFFFSNEHIVYIIKIKIGSYSNITKEEGIFRQTLYGTLRNMEKRFVCEKK